MPARDPYRDEKVGANTLPERMVDVTPSDSSDLEYVAQCLYIGVGGNVRVANPDGDIVTFQNCASGQEIWGRFSRVYVTSTTASGIIARGNW